MVNDLNFNVFFYFKKNHVNTKLLESYWMPCAAHVIFLCLVELLCFALLQFI